MKHEQRDKTVSKFLRSRHRRNGTVPEENEIYSHLRFHGSLNAVFGKIGRIASQDVSLYTLYPVNAYRFYGTVSRSVI
jgi:hypothetical protein